jgi:beta-phosphoglucomutase-like phosphatase (HAD superfamily)
MSETEGKDARRQLVEAEGVAIRALASARALIGELEEENRKLRQSAERSHDEIFTEKEFAALFKVSQDTIERLRKSGKIFPYWLGSQPRYSRAEHFAHAAELFGTVKRRRNAKGVK